MKKSVKFATNNDEEGEVFGSHSNCDGMLYPKTYFNYYNNDCKGHRNYITKFFCKLKDKVLGAIIGFSEGISTGMLSAGSVSGKGGWFFGALSQTTGTILGAVLCSFSGTIMGAVIGREKIQQKYRDYRRAYIKT